MGVSAITRRRDVSVPRALRVLDRLSGIVCALALALLVALAVGTVAGYHPMIDYTGSMRPAIAPGDLLITHSVPAATVRVGEIVSFADPGLGGKLVTHRVVNIHPSAARIDFLTRGDANATPESWSVRRQASVGALTLRIPAVGRAVAWMATGWVRTALLTLSALVLSAAVLRRIWRA
jgi:signal peptidase I